MNSLTPRCPVCTSPSTRKEPFHYIFRQRALHGFECSNCGSIFIHPQPTAEELKALYGADYFESGDVRCGHIEGYFEAESLADLVDYGLLSRIESLKPAGKFLEIGCAGGATLHAAQQKGYDVQGVEFSEDASRKAKEKFGLRVFTGDVADAQFANGSFDVVYMGDVLEHLPDPVKSLREIHRIMAPGGLIVITVPSQTNTLFSRFGFLAYGALGKSVTVQLPPYHLFEYRPRSLRFLLGQSGFRIHSLVQDIIPPRQIKLRGPFLQRAGKKLFHYPNWALTRLLHQFGDRITAFAFKERPAVFPGNSSDN